VEPLVVSLGGSHVIVSDAVALSRVSGDGGAIATLDDDHGVSVIRVARVGVIDENITSLDVAGRSLEIAAGASPAVDLSKAIAEVLGADLLLAARIATAGETLIQVLVTTSKDALADKVCAITVLTTVATVIIAPVRPGSTFIVSTAAIMIGTIPPLLGICNYSITIICSSTKAQKSHNNKNV